MLNRTKESDHRRQNIIKPNSWACTGASPRVRLMHQSIA